MAPQSALKEALRPLAGMLRALYSRRRQEVFEFDLAWPLPELRAEVPALFRVGSAADVAAVGRDPDNHVGRSSGRLHELLLREGAIPIVGLIGDRIVYHGWTATGVWHAAGSLAIPLGRGKAIMFRGFCVRDLRGRGLHKQALSYVLSVLKEKGVRRAYLNVEDANVPALRAVERVGLRHVGGYEVIWIAGRVRILMDESLRRRVTEDAPG